MISFDMRVEKLKERQVRLREIERKREELGEKEGREGVQGERERVKRMSGCDRRERKDIRKVEREGERE